MIIVQEVDGVNRLVCIKDQSFTIASAERFDIQAGAIGAITCHPVGTEINGWASYELNIIAPTVIENSVIWASGGSIGPNAVFVNTLIEQVGHIRVEGELERMSSFRGCHIQDVTVVQIDQATVQHLKISKCHELTLCRSDVSDTKSMRSIQATNSKIKDCVFKLDKDFISNSKVHTVSLNGEQLPPAVSFINSTVIDTHLYQNALALVCIQSTVLGCGVKGSVLLNSVIAKESDIGYDFIVFHAINCWFRRVTSKRTMQSYDMVQFVDCKMFDTMLSLDHGCTIGDMTQRIQG